MKEVAIKYNFSDLEKEYRPFSAKTLSDGYLLTMFNKFLVVTPNPTILKQGDFVKMNSNNEMEFRKNLLSSYDGNENINELLNFYILIKKFNASLLKEIYPAQTFQKYFKILKNINLINDQEDNNDEKIGNQTLSKIFSINSDWLRYFVNLVEIKNVTATAKKMSVTKAALSQSISGIEKNLQIFLFEKNKNFEELTYAGKIVYEKTKEIMNNLIILDNVCEEIKSGKPDGEINFAWFNTWGKDIVFQSIENFISKYRNVYFKKDSIDWYKIEKLVSEGKFDIGFMPHKPTSENIEIAEIIDIEYGIVSFPQPKKNWDEFSYIVNNNCISRFYLNNVLNSWPAEEYNRKIIMECNSLYLTVEFCKSGFGAAYVPVSFVKNELEKGTLAIVADVPFKKENKLYIVYRKGMFFNSALKEFMKELRKNIKYTEKGTQD